MNKEKMQGFLCGLAATVVMLGIGGTVWAAGKTITVDDGVSVTVNGVPFTPKDANGKEVPLFSYNGTIYAPVRAFGNAAGFSVDYDAATRTAVLETSDFITSSDPNAGSYISAEKARELALADAGVKSAEATFLKTRLDKEDGKMIYEVEFCAGNTEYDYELDAVSGKILEKDYDCDDYDWANRENQQSDRISADAAKAIALERLPGGSVYKCELDQDNGRWKYEIELRVNGREYECEIDAATGEILKWEMDD